MLDQVRFEFVIELLSFTHMGDGNTFEAGFIEIEKDGGTVNPEVSSIQRGAGDLPVIEAASLRGAIKARMNDCGLRLLALRLFGEDDINETGGAGSIRFHAGFLDNKDEVRDFPLRLPHWNKRPMSFIMPGIRMDENMGTVKDKLLYHAEMLPDGCRFRFSGTFLGAERDFKELAGTMFELLAEEDGFDIGGKTGYGDGRARLAAGSVAYEVRHYEPEKKSFSISKGSLDLKPGGSRACIHELKIRCPGPYFILDPAAAARDRNGPDMLALMRDEETPAFSGKVVTQELRRRSAWLESLDSLEEAGFDYSRVKLDDPDEHLRAGDDPRKLTRTQRLFGVAGWGKRVRVAGVLVKWNDQARYEGQGIKLDVFTQAPIDGALIEYETPANLEVTVRLRLDETGLQPGDKEHFAAVLEDFRCNGARRPRFGHAAGTGFGAFEMVSAQGGDA